MHRQSVAGSLCAACGLPSAAIDCLWHCPGVEGSTMRLFRDLGVAVMVVGIALMACKKGEDEEKSGDKTEESKSGDEGEKKEGASASGDKIGVAACDEFLEKYEKCVMDKVPDAQKEMMKGSIKQWREAWKQAAATPAGKTALESSCKQTLEAQKQATAAWGCEW